MIRPAVPEREYRAIEALNVSALKELARSPLHFQHARLYPKTTAAMALGTAAHCATLEPERFARDYAVWDRRTDSGRSAPRTGKAWEEFVAAQSGRTILTADEMALALGMAAAVRADRFAMQYLDAGEPEVTLQAELGGRRCKGRVDWLHRPVGQAVIVGLKTARDCRPIPFGSVAAKLGYALQWAFYADLYETLTRERPRMVEVVVESAPPYAVVTYQIPDDVLEYGRDEYRRLMDLLAQCEASGQWPGPAEAEQVLTLPSWVYGSDDDLSDLELET